MWASAFLAIGLLLCRFSLGTSDVPHEPETHPSTSVALETAPASASSPPTEEAQEGGALSVSANAEPLQEQPMDSEETMGALHPVTLDDGRVMVPFVDWEVVDAADLDTDLPDEEEDEEEDWPEESDMMMEMDMDEDEEEFDNNNNEDDGMMEMDGKESDTDMKKMTVSDSSESGQDDTVQSAGTLASLPPFPVSSAPSAFPSSCLLCR
uniref:Uncharacterized protein n=1 Tax=Chromera velia CCMP2878 TaxID=1169474 RepID=A0A0G4FK57_9ALVE|eukprot:Cvel_17449.t1-p1 / transcript=Cvel_17449.t1 / gene=Cvel_17449 / organism=Chromera_velia_CCMP2878 / gene_product=hypothetical protein / transcript_product=hypothetical protein / location=Cvel_scaffold1393:1049-1770(-) / protein_length=208 / sequence_SO=supercontig / SO=protein_coding / is_pseudo=false